MTKDIHDFYKCVTPGSLLGVECIDDRGYEDWRDSLQIAAAPLGAAACLAGALVMEGNRSVLDVPIGVIAKSAARHLAHDNLEARTHKACLAEIGTSAIAGVIVDSSNSTRERAGYILGRDISDKEFDRSQRYFWHFLLTDSRHYRSAEVEAVCMGTCDAYPAIERSGLAFKDHRAAELVSNHRDGTVFRAQAAYMAGMPAYNLDMWAAKRYTRALSNGYPVTTESMLASTAIYHGAITQLLPHPSGGEGVDIRLRAAA